MTTIERSPYLGEEAIPSILESCWYLLSDSDAKTLRSIALRLLIKRAKALAHPSSFTPEVQP